MTQDKVKKADLSVDLLDANDYNPNRMTEEEFRELVAEVGHLGRISKPIIVLPNGHRYTIVDGEHNWRAAREVGIREIPCEIIDVDDFEAMRQTWKRNLGGTPDPLRTGKMFEKMLEQRGISQRELAKEINVSEATIRNHLNYVKVRQLCGSFMEARAEDVQSMVADAEEAGLLENVETVESRTASDAADSAVSALSVRQVRLALDLPEALRDRWLAAGAPMDVLPKHVKGPCVSKKLQALCSCDLLYGIVDVQGEFDESLRRALGFLNARDDLCVFPDRDEYMAIACSLRYSAEVMSIFPLHLRDGRYEPVLSLDEWANALDSGVGLPATMDKLRWVKVEIACKIRRKQLEIDNLPTPRDVHEDSSLAEAPDFIRDSLLLTREEKLTLLRYDREDFPAEENLEAVRRVCSDVGQLNDNHFGEKAYLISRCVDESEAIRLERLLAEPQGDLELRGLCSEAAQSLVDHARMADGMVGEQALAEVLTERLMSMARPELALVLGLWDGRCSRTILRSWLNTCDAVARKEVNGGRAAA